MEKLVHIRLGDEERTIVNRVVRDYGVTFTAAMGIIIREWGRTNPEETVVISGNGSDHEQN